MKYIEIYCQNPTWRRIEAFVREAEAEEGWKVEAWTESFVCFHKELTKDGGGEVMPSKNNISLLSTFQKRLDLKEK